jgi:excinuclease ABC subunit C
MVAFENGKKCPSALRRFKIKYVEGQNDYGSMGEVVFRRLSRAKEETENETESPKFLPLPEVILVDGGLAHVHTVKSIVENFGSVIVAGLVKDSKHNLRGLMLSSGTEINIKDIKYASRLLNEISEEVHRAAIGYHKIKRSKSMLKTELEDIPGIGKSRSVSLLKYFGSVEKSKMLQRRSFARRAGHEYIRGAEGLCFFHAGK